MKKEDSKKQLFTIASVLALPPLVVFYLFVIFCGFAGTCM